MSNRLNRIASDESGVTIIEVIVSAVLMVAISASIFTALNAVSRAGAQERHQARAYAIAQEDQARIRSLQVSAVSHLSQTNTVTDDGIAYTVVSTGTPAIDRTATAACDSGNSSADYIKISSSVTWTSMAPQKPVVIESIVTPPNGSLDANRGALGVSIINSNNGPYSGINVTGTGAGSFSGVTTSTGCVLFGDLPEGNYTVTPSLSNLVDSDGNAPIGIATSVVAGSSNTLGLQYDKGGTINPLTFKTVKPSGGAAVASTADAVTVFNTGMTQGEQFGTTGTPVSNLSLTPLFPFLSPDSVYAGVCTTNGLGASPMTAAVTVPQNGGSIAASITLPALKMLVRSGTSSRSAGSLVGGATVTATDQTCSVNGTPVKHTLKTTTAATGRGQLYGSAVDKSDDPGLPYSTNYTVCVSGMSSAGTVKKVTTNNVALTSATVPKNLNTIYLNSGTAGPCP